MRAHWTRPAGKTYKAKRIKPKETDGRRPRAALVLPMAHAAGARKGPSQSVILAHGGPFLPLEEARIRSRKGQTDGQHLPLVCAYLWATLLGAALFWAGRLDFCKRS